MVTFSYAGTPQIVTSGHLEDAHENSIKDVVRIAPRLFTVVLIFVYKDLLSRDIFHFSTLVFVFSVAKICIILLSAKKSETESNLFIKYITYL